MGKHGQVTMGAHLLGHREYARSVASWKGTRGKWACGKGTRGNVCARGGALGIQNAATLLRYIT